MKLLPLNLLNDGGPLFMYTTLVALLICILLIIKTLLKGDKNEKSLKLIKSISLFALVWGFLGMMIGLIGAFDAISVSKGISHNVLATGLKIALLSPAFGAVTFLIARLGIIGLILREK
ncbi:MotA/TolQ/ExbB proton channel family protein [Polaribacter sargassicola]|uniref:MotA/TolQ/ExbB proton channel family protein n=1 Tax=Polaribacter sargassicola TaxID=2836891 RepID=UPI001F188C59|nr:MotA/TolQ/ExbB proton channel family protein [Polaribacter sp. DS7-9]MCG1035979.1 MotA/TolQ/ExbB proton channel family protein [Polaribacter sp. DS7-9]